MNRTTRKFVAGVLLWVLAAILPATAMAGWKTTRVAKSGSIISSAQLRPAISCAANSCKLSKSRPFANEGRAAPGGLPDGKIAIISGGHDIVRAWYILPTRRYGHGILGDAIEAGGLAIKTSDGKTIKMPLSESQVFEDRTPRLADLDGDGRVEIITILTSLNEGGSIAVFGLENNRLVLRAKTPFIGRSSRWINIANIADFNGDGKLDIPGVWTPHIGGTLKFWTFAKNGLRQIGQMGGFSNHFIGSPEQRLSAIADVDGNGTPDLILPSADRLSLRIIGFKNGKLRQLAAIAMPAQIDKAIAVTGSSDKTIITVGLADGSVYAVHR